MYYKDKNEYFNLITFGLVETLRSLQQAALYSYLFSFIQETIFKLSIYSNKVMLQRMHSRHEQREAYVLQMEKNQRCHLHIQHTENNVLKTLINDCTFLSYKEDKTRTKGRFSVSGKCNGATSSGRGSLVRDERERNEFTR